jgi:hypothetical protein
MLLGIRNGDGGLGNNADEIKTATLLFDNIVIKPYQYEIIEALNEILYYNDISLKLYFKTIQPLEFTELDNTQTDEQVKEETGLSSHTCLSSNVADALIAKGEKLGDEWTLVDEFEVDYDKEDELDAEINFINEKNKKSKSALSKIWQFVSTGTARPNAKSPEQDETIDGVQFITRYVYSGNAIGQREFCNKMINADKVYRKEDIIAMENQAVNAGFGKGGSDNYSIWLYKGGPRCEHKWLRRTYANFEGVKIDPTNPNANTISSATAEQYGYRIRNEKEVAMKPADMPTKGFTQEYWNKMGFKN